MKDFIKASAIVADADGRVDLTDETLAKIEQLFVPRAGGITTNTGCPGGEVNNVCRNSGCDGSINGTCSNTSCSGSVTKKAL